MGLGAMRLAALGQDDPGPRVPGSFAVSTQLMQDAVLAHGVSAGEGLNQEAVFGNPFKDGREEALILDVNKQLTYLERTDSSDTGWVQTAVSMRPDVKNLFSEVVVAVHPNGSVWAFCVPAVTPAAPPQLFMLTKTGAKPDGTAMCAWVPAPMNSSAIVLKPMWSLSVSYAPDAGPMIVGQAAQSGVTCVVISALFNDIIDSPDIHWTTRTGTNVAATGRIVGGGYVPGSPRPAGDYIYYVLDKTTLTRYSFSSEASKAELFDSVRLSVTAEAFCGTWNVPNLPHGRNQGDVGYIYMDTNGDLVTGYVPPTQSGAQEEERASGLDFIVTKDSQGNVTSQPRSWQDVRGMLHIFGVTGAQSGQAAGTLSVLHQTDWRSTTRPFFDPILPVWTTAQVAGAPAGIGGFDLMNSADRLMAFDFTGSGKSDHLLAFRPSNTAPVMSVLRREVDGSFNAAFNLPANTVWPGSPIPIHYERAPEDRAGGDNYVLVTALVSGGAATTWSLFKGVRQSNGSYELKSQASGQSLVQGSVPFLRTDQMAAFDYTGSGKNDHLLVYRPGSGIAWVLGRASGGSAPFEIVAETGSGIGGFPLTDVYDRVTGFDYDSSGSSKYLLAYRPAGGLAYIVTSDGKGGFTAAMSSKNGIGGFDLALRADRLVPFDYTGLGFNDHILAYRPGIEASREIWVLERIPNTNTYKPKFGSEKSMGGYDFSSLNDLVTGFDYTGTGALPYLVAYRPGTGKVSVMGHRGANNIAPVYQAPPPSTGTIVTIGLHTNVSSFLLDPQPDYWPSELIKMSGVSAAEAYCICTQDITTSEWQMDRVRLPDPKPGTATPFIVSHYVADVTLLSKSGEPMPGHNVTVSADSLVEIQIGAISYQVGPGREIAITTDGVGKLAVSIAARGLNPPVVHLNADGLESGTAINFASQVNEFLAGKAGLPSQSGKLTADLLQNAKAPTNGAGSSAVGAPPPALVPNWGDLKERGLTPQIVVDHFSNMYAQAASGPSPALRFHLDGSQRPQSVHSYVIQLWDPDRPAFQTFANQAELDAYRAYRHTHPAFGGWWDDAVSWASDTWEGIKSGASRVAEVIVSEIVEIAVWVGDAIVSLGEIVIAAVEQAVQAVEAVLQMIADAVIRAIDWLKSLFAFDDIWKTKLAIDNLFKQSAAIIPSTITHIGTVTDGWFQEKRQEANAYFDELKAFYQHAHSGDLVNQAPAITTSSGEHVDQSATCPTQGNWMLNQINVHETQNPGALTASIRSALGDEPGDALELLETLWTEVTNCGMLEALSTLGSDLLDVIQDFLGGGNPSAKDKVPLVDLLNALQQFVDAVLAAADDLVQAILKFVAAAIPLCLDKLNEQLTGLPVLDSLYKWIQQQARPNDTPEPLTLSGLFTLGLAFVATFTYKLMLGVNNAPFPNESSIPVIPKPSWSTQLAVCSQADDQDPDPVANEHMLNTQVAFLAMATVAETSMTVLTDLYFEGGANEMLVGWLNQAAGSLCIVYDCPPILGIPWGPLVDDDGKKWGNGFVGLWACNWIGWAADLISMIVGSIPDNKLGARAVPLKNAFGVWPGACVVGALGLIKLSLAIEGCSVAKQDPASWTSYVTGTGASLLQLVRAATYKAAYAGNPTALTLYRVVAGLDGALTFVSNLIGLSISVYEKIWRPAVADQTLPPVKPGIKYEYKLKATFKDSYGTTKDAGLLQGDFQLWTAAGLPKGLELDAERTGNITGSISSSGIKSFTITTSVWDSYGPPQKSADVTLTLPVGTSPVSFLQYIGGSGVNAAAGTVFASTQKVRVLDAHQNGVKDAVVIFTAPDCGATGSYNGQSSAIVYSDEDGYAEAPVFTAGGIPNVAYQVTAKIPGVPVPPVEFKLINRPCDAV